MISESVLKEHNVIYRDIDYFTFLCNYSFIRYNKCFLNMIVFVLNEGIECAVNGIVFSRFYFDWNSGKTVIIVNKIIYFSFATIIIVEQLMT